MGEGIEGKKWFCKKELQIDIVEGKEKGKEGKIVTESFYGAKICMVN